MVEQGMHGFYAQAQWPRSPPCPALEKLVARTFLARLLHSAVLEDQRPKTIPYLEEVGDHEGPQ